MKFSPKRVSTNVLSEMPVNDTFATGHLTVYHTMLSPHWVPWANLPVLSQFPLAGSVHFAHWQTLSTWANPCKKKRFWMFFGMSNRSSKKKKGSAWQRNFCLWMNSLCGLETYTTIHGPESKRLFALFIVAESLPGLLSQEHLLFHRVPNPRVVVEHTVCVEVAETTFLQKQHSYRNSLANQNRGLLISRNRNAWDSLRFC